MSDQFHTLSYNAHRQVSTELDARILAFFGSYENAEKFGHLYVLETTPPKFEMNAEKDLAISYTMEWEYRIRLKTEEELAADQGPEDA